MTRALTMVMVHGDAPPLCIRCGYDLRGLARGGECPECAAPVAAALDSKLLRFSGPVYVRKLRAGAVLVALATAGDFLLAGAIAWSLFLSDGFTGLGMIALALLLTLTAGTMVRFVGWWLLSVVDPRSAGSFMDPTSRRLLRGALIADAAIVAAAVLLIMGTPSGTGRELLPVLFVVYVAARITHFFSSMPYLIWMASRMPSEVIAARARRLTWLVPAIMLVGTVPFAVGPVIALGLYWHLMQRVGRELKRIRAGELPAQAA